jgi:MinD superfamily P-loop ATPase
VTDTPAGVIINRDGTAYPEVDEYCKAVGLPILLRLPLEREIGRGIAQGKSLLEINPKYRDVFQQLYAQIMNLMADRDNR